MTALQQAKRKIRDLTEQRDRYRKRLGEEVGIGIEEREKKSNSYLADIALKQRSVIASHEVMIYQMVNALKKIKKDPRTAVKIADKILSEPDIQLVIQVKMKNQN